MKQSRTIATGIIFSLIISLCLIPDASRAATIRLDQKKVVIEEGESVTLKIKNSKKKAKWTIKSGKSCIRLVGKKKSQVTITGRKKGTARVQCRIGKKKWYCQVQVTKRGTKGREASAPPSVVPSPVGTPPAVPTAVPSEIPSSVPLPTDKGKNTSDVTALRALIKQQQSQGAALNDNIDNKEMYQWNDEGRLVSIDWGYKKISGEVSFSELTALEKISCSGNSIRALDVRKNKRLKRLECDGNQLTTLDIGPNLTLTELHCCDNELTALDVSQIRWLRELYCSHNKLTMLKVTQNKSLENLDCSHNQLTEMEVSENESLKIFDCSYNQLATLEVSQNKGLKELYCSGNQLTALEVSQNEYLLSLECDGNQLGVLDVTCCVDIFRLYCQDNQLKELKVRGCKWLKEFSCGNNQLTVLDVTDTRIPYSYYNSEIKIIDETDYNYNHRGTLEPTPEPSEY